MSVGGIALLDIAGWILYVVALWFAVSWAMGIRRMAATPQGVTHQTVNTTMLWVVALLAVPVLHIHPLHLAWVFPAALVLGFLSTVFPFSLLWLLGRVFARVLCAF